MTKSLRCLLFALLAPTAGLLSLTAQPLETVVARAIEENPDVLAGIEQLRAAGFDVRIAKGAFLPTVTAGADGGSTAADAAPEGTGDPADASNC